MDVLTIFWILFLAGLFFSILMALFAGFGSEMGGHDFGADHDFGIGHDVGAGGGDVDVSGVDGHGGDFHGSGEIALSPVSPITIGAFIGCFGGGGIVADSITGNLVYSLIAAVIIGFLGAFGLYYIVGRIAYAIQGSSEARVGELIGEIGEVITPIHGEKMGEISYVFKGSRYNGPARSVDGRDINKNKPVKIWRVIGTTFYVKEISAEETSFPEQGTETKEL
jgi:membrane protein implicated in regulation of membrane protease activity